MTSINEKAKYLLSQLNKYAENGDSEGVAAVAALLRQEIAQGVGDCDCEDCDCDDTVEAGLVDMMEEAILEDDQDVLVKALATALMLSAKEADWVDLSVVAHGIWVEK